MSEWTWLQPISKEIFESKYNLHNQKSINDIFKSVAEEIASVEKNKKLRKQWTDKFYDLMINKYFIPGGRILANARPKSKMKQYNNCFTIDINDDMEEIYNSLKEDAMISKTGGGVGFDVSKLRPKNDVLSKGGTASGPISFLKVFDQSAKIIQSAGFRRSAHIALMDIDHPDIEEFITCKKGSQNNELTQFNISVRISDKFIDAVKNDLDWDLQFNGKIYKTVKAKYLYDLLCNNAYNHNEPGIFNIDKVEKYNNGWWEFKLDRVNPCGEICVSKDTEINTKEGIKTILTIVEEFNQGKVNYVLSYNIDSGVKEYKLITDAFLTKKDAEVMELSIAEYGKTHTLKCTPDHKIFTKNRGYLKATDLSYEDDIIINSKNLSMGKLMRIRIVDDEDVYDITVKDNNNFYANDILVHNCMPSYSLCCLGSMNLTSFMHNSFTNDAYFDFNLFAEKVGIAVRFLDNVLDATEYPLEKIEDFSRKWRRIGLGFTGLGDVLSMLKIPYGSEDSKRFVSDMSKHLMIHSYFSSASLAKEKGAFPACDNNKLLKSNFIKELSKKVGNTLSKEIKKYGLRNIGLNTCAPTGCLVPSTEIKTDLGILSIEDLFEVNGYDIKKIKNRNGEWYTPTIDLSAETMNGYKRITKLFVNGKAETISINDGIIEGTLNHKVLVKQGDKVFWKPLEELQEGDLILKKK